MGGDFTTFVEQIHPTMYVELHPFDYLETFDGTWLEMCLN